MSPEENIKKNNIKLPKAPDPVGAYVATKKTGNLLFISGQISMNEKGELIKGKLGKDFDISNGYKAAERCALSLVAQVKKSKLTKKKKTNQNLSSINKIRSIIPGVTHIDYSARVQTVNKKTNQIYYGLISEFFSITKVPILINTSFNIRGEPIVCTPKDAFKCFMGTNLDALVINNFILEKNKQNKNLILDYKNEFKLD